MEHLNPTDESTAFASAMAKYNQPLPASLAPAPAADPPAPPDANPDKTPPAKTPAAAADQNPGGSPVETPESLQTFAAAMRKAGRTEEEISSALKSAGHAYTLAPAIEDKRNAGELEIDRQFSGELSRPIVYLGAVPPGTSTEALAALDTECKAFLTAAGIPGQIGPSLIENLLDTGAKLRRMSPADAADYKRDQTALATRILGGPENLQAAVKAAADVLKPAVGSRFYELVIRTGAIHSAEFLLAFHQQSARNAARARAKA